MIDNSASPSQYLDQILHPVHGLTLALCNVTYLDTVWLHLSPDF